MKKISRYVINVLVLLLITLPIAVNANIVCNDGTVSPSCADCHRGCCSHHGGCSSSYSNSHSSSNKNTTSHENKNSSNNTNQNPNAVEKSKSMDASLKKLTVDGEEIHISLNMSYSTKKESVVIHAIPRNNNATIEYNKNVELAIGNNIVDIKVTSEQGIYKNFKLNIVRENVLSDNKNIKIFIDDEELIFESFKSKIIYLFNDKDKIDIKYELEDKNAKVEIIGNENLKVGKNEVIVKVTAENGEEQDYIIVVEKNSKFEEKILNIVVINFVIVFISGIGCLIFYFIKKAKQ